jgi:hypothetical protein
MNKEFIPYEEALALRELGFNEPCIGFLRKDTKKLFICDFEINNDFIRINDYKVIVPLYQQAFRWFRDKYKLVVAITVENDDFDYTIYIPWKIKEVHDSTRFTSYEEAELVCLQELIKIVKEKNND